MNWYDIGVLYKRELKSALRERTIVVNSILIPILLYPLLLWLMYTGISFVSGQISELDSRIALVNFPASHEDFRRELQRDKHIRLVDSNDPQTGLKAGSLDAFVRFDAGSDNNFRVHITYDESRAQSSQARQRLEKKLTDYRDRYIQLQAARLGITKEQFQNFWVESDNVSTDRQMGQFVLGLLLPMFLMIMLVLGGFFPSIDATAGERENSTWETMLTVATPRANIVIAKYLYVATMSATAAILNVTAMMFSMRSIFGALGGVAGSLTFRLPVQAIPVLALGAILMSLFVAAGMMILASFARTFKEGQSMVSPFYLLIVLPVSFLQSPGAEFTPRIALIPIVNVTMMFREAIAGVFHWRLIGTTVAVEIVCVTLALRVAAQILNQEDVVTGSYTGSFGKFFKERLMKRA
jgi:sodium transport system permease protein